ncbi:terminase [Zhihengliuella sp.]|uniref:terminase n=1 Tax=Zhihengliuella sp. TaxID=1954483 RepID=UPI0028121353|nr:terminase [Zhihengliuella sp.]
MAPAVEQYVVDFPTLGFLAADWIEAHCPVPTGFQRGQPFVQSDWQLWCTVNHYQVKRRARWVPERPILAPAFHNRRSQVIAPQKTGKGPWLAGVTLNEARGPALFAGWAHDGEAYECSDWQCDCGFVYEYREGEPKGMPWPTPHIQLFASSFEQVDNTYGPLKEMVRLGPLSDSIRVGEEFSRIGTDGKIEAVTSSALSRLGAPITFGGFDETGTWTESNKLKGVGRTARRGLAGIGGRSIETTNVYDPSMNSTAQETAESRAHDIFRFYRRPPEHLKFKSSADRRKILEFVYAGSPWVDLDAVEAEAVELMEKDPQEAERFYGNILVQGKGAWMPDDLWAATESMPEDA